MRNLHLLFAVIAVSTLYGQPSPFESKPSRGNMPFANLVASNVDSVDTTSGNVNLAIPLATLPPWRAGQTFGVSLIYNSSIWDIAPELIDTPINSTLVKVAYNKLIAGTNGGWKYNFRNLAVELEIRQFPGGDTLCNSAQGFTNEDALRLYRVRIGLPDGSQHILHLRGHGTEHYGGTADGYYAFGLDGKRSPCASIAPGSSIYPANLSGDMTYFTADGSYLKFEIQASSNWALQPWRLYLPDGTRIRGQGRYATSIDDPNGNIVSINDFCNDEACNDVSTYIENVQPSEVQVRNAHTRQIEVHYSPGAWSQSTTDLIRNRGFSPNPTSLLTTTVQWSDTAILPIPTQPPAPPASPARIYKCWQYDSVNYGNCSLNGAPLRQVSSITLPNSRSYSFEYQVTDGQGTGELSKMRTPAGAEYFYEYTHDNAPFDTTAVDGLANPVTERRMNAAGHNLTWNYAWSLTQCTQTGPDGTNTYHFYNKQAGSSWFRGLTWKTVLSSGETIERVWHRNAAPGVRIDNVANNPYVYAERRTFAGMYVDTIRTLDRNGNVLYNGYSDWRTAPSEGGLRAEMITYAVPIPAQATPAANFPNIANSPSTQAPSSLNSDYGYWQPHHTGPQSTLFPGVWAYRRLTSPTRREVWTSGGGKAATQYSYGVVTARDYYGTIPNRDTAYLNGNVYTQRVWNEPYPADPGPGEFPTFPPDPLTDANSITTKYTYDDYGNQLTEAVMDDNGTTELRKTSRLYGSVNGVVGLYPTQEITGAGPTLRSTTSIWDYDTGLRLKSTDDQNSGIVQDFAYDGFGRPAGVTNAGIHKSSRLYDDASLKTYDNADARSFLDQGAGTTTTYDVLGRVVLTETREAPAGQAVYVRSSYLRDNTSSGELVSNPYRATNATTMPLDLGWNCTIRDVSGRVTKQMSFAAGSEASARSLCVPGTVASATLRMVEYFYGTSTRTAGGVGKFVDVKEYNTSDAGFSITRRIYDGLDRLVEVRENVGGSEQVTALYTYDVLDNLIAVWPQNRTFTYSTSSRLLSATNPESGTITYTYYRDGSLKTKTDALNRATTYNYDALGRNTSKVFSTGEAGVVNEYYLIGDAGSSGQVGRLKKVSRTGIGSTDYTTYDAAGRVLSLAQTIVSGASAPVYNVGYQYFANGTPSRVVYPGGRQVNYAADEIGRVTKVCNGSCDASTPDRYAVVEGATAGTTGYAAHGAVARVTYGNTMVETATFTSLLQPWQQMVTGGGSQLLLGLTLGYGTQGKNNGNIVSQQIQSSGLDVTQTFGYTPRNQLKSAVEVAATLPTPTQTWNRTWDYDLYGNQWMVTATPEDNTDSTVPRGANWFNSKNQLSSDDKFHYNDAGEMDRLQTMNFTYSTEGQILTAGPLRTYVYDGHNRRVKTTEDGVETRFVYGANGELMAEFSAAIPATGRQYLTSDWLGSTRMTSDNSAAVTSRRDYYPFGVTIPTSVGTRGTVNDAAVATTQLFTGKERDAESGLDYFGARHLSSPMGRFASSDPGNAGADVSKPQSWNGYGYALNNPHSYVDSNGMWPFYIHNEMYRVLTGDFSSRQLYQLSQVNWDQDFGPGAQEPESSHMHSMCGSGQRMDECVSRIRVFIEGQLSLANELSGGGKDLNKDAITAFARAAHALTDMGSPAHVSADGTPIVWTNGRAAGLAHILQEGSYPGNWFRVGQSIRLLAAGETIAFPYLAGKHKNQEAWVRRQIEQVVERHFSGISDSSRNAIDEAAARSCALGNPAACGVR